MILAINTASENNSIAVYRPSPKGYGVVCQEFGKEVAWQSYKTQSQELLPKINALLQANKPASSADGLQPTALKAIVVFAGPGSFTGLRVGVSVANALAWSLDIPVIGVKLSVTLRQSSGQISQQLSALEIAKRGYKIYGTKKLKHFTKIVEPFYDFPLK